ncbi:MAG: drug/metabolite transporter (DMT)-like permease [Planctomycetota bacterium]
MPSLDVNSKGTLGSRYTKAMQRAALGPTTILTLLTLVAFAGNSILCRLALAGGLIDPVSFNAIRLGSGALVLVPFLCSPGSRGQAQASTPWSPFAAAALFVYGITFSMAYVTLDAGVGALLLFGSVQVTMLSVGFLRGERPTMLQKAGIIVAVGGFLVQVLPGLTAPAPTGALLMTTAGIAWGTYSLHGRAVGDPRMATARNFLLAAPLGVVCLLLGQEQLVVHTRGVLLAVTSGTVTSGLGYILWYTALRGHTATSAGIVQLAVPILAAIAGVALLSEDLTLRFAVSACLTLGGIAVVTTGNRRAT